MKTALIMNFSIDRENKKIKVEREFASPLLNVWAAWTESELLDKWWAPKPWQTKTKSMDFRVGGSWLYAMVGPDNTTHWCTLDYKTINTMKSFSGLDAFCDETGIIKEDFPRSLWTNTFRENSESTIVYIEIEYQKLADLETIIEMGFKEGFSAALENLDAFFKS
jgi:PhnB protein